jgi:hypothetical protein
MFSTTIKRSVATLGVVAGLLAAAGPASAQIAPGTIGVKAPANALPAGSISGTEMSKAILSVKAPKLSDVNRQGAWPAKVEIGARQETETGSGANHLRGEAIDIIP